MKDGIGAYPLYWPAGRPRHKGTYYGSPFGTTTMAVQRDKLLKELRLLNARKIVISSNIPVRMDGIMRGDIGNAVDPGVAVYFEYKGKETCIACDRYYQVRDNLRAICLTIGAIRGIARWGSTDMLDRAFHGFTALPSHGTATWRGVFGFSATESVTKSDVETRYAHLMKTCHPDKPGGSHEKAVEINIAREAALLSLEKI